MLPPGCKAFNYDAVPRARQILELKVAQLLQSLRADVELCKLLAARTRPAHALLYFGLTPEGHEYYAGHFRGEAYRCLRTYSVMVRSDPSVGLPPSEVLEEMTRFESAVLQAFAALDVYAASGRSRASLLIRIAETAALLFEWVLRVHPYADGNGHIARLLVCAFMGRYDVWPRAWSVEPRPAEWPAYLEALMKQRHNGTQDLARAFLEMARWG